MNEKNKSIVTIKRGSERLKRETTVSSVLLSEECFKYKSFVKKTLNHSKSDGDLKLVSNEYRCASSDLDLQEAVKMSDAFEIDEQILLCEGNQVEAKFNDLESFKAYLEQFDPIILAKLFRRLDVIVPEVNGIKIDLEVLKYVSDEFVHLIPDKDLLFIYRDLKKYCGEEEDSDEITETHQKLIDIFNLNKRLYSLRDIIANGVILTPQGFFAHFNYFAVDPDEKNNRDNYDYRWEHRVYPLDSSKEKLLIPDVTSEVLLFPYTTELTYVPYPAMVEISGNDKVLEVAESLILEDLREYFSNRFVLAMRSDLCTFKTKNETEIVLDFHKNFESLSKERSLSLLRGMLNMQRERLEEIFKYCEKFYYYRLYLFELLKLEHENEENKKKADNLLNLFLAEFLGMDHDIYIQQMFYFRDAILNYCKIAIAIIKKEGVSTVELATIEEGFYFIKKEIKKAERNFQDVRSKFPGLGFEKVNDIADRLKEEFKTYNLEHVDMHLLNLDFSDLYNFKASKVDLGDVIGFKALFKIIEKSIETSRQEVRFREARKIKKSVIAKQTSETGIKRKVEAEMQVIDKKLTAALPLIESDKMRRDIVSLINEDEAVKRQLVEDTIRAKSINKGEGHRAGFITEVKKTSLSVSGKRSLKRRSKKKKRK